MIAVLVGAAILAFPLSLIVNKLNGTNSDTAVLREQNHHIAVQQDQITALLGQVNGLSLESRKLLCSFGAFVVEQPIVKLVNETKAAFFSRIEGYQNVLHDLRRVDCQVTLDRTQFQKEVSQQAKRITQVLGTSGDGSGGGGSGGHSGGHSGGQNPGQNHTPGTNSHPNIGTPGGTKQQPSPDPPNGNSGGNGGGVGNGVNDILDGVQGAANGALNGLKKGLDDILHGNGKP